MRWKIGNINYASGTVKIAGRDDALCVYDNGTTTCGAGHSITIAGKCISQSIGTINSSSTCLTDYIESTNTYVTLINEPSAKVATFNSVSFGGQSTYLTEILKTGCVEYDEWIFVKSLTLSSSFDFISWSGLHGSSMVMYLDYDYRNSIFKLLQRDSGWIVHDVDVTSSFFQLDVFGTTIVLHPYYYKYKVVKEGKIVSEGVPDGWLSEVKTVVSGIEGICVGDNTPPAVENILPPADSHLNTVYDNISFDVVDAVGGVQKSSINITISGNITSQPEGMAIVTAGNPVAQASFNGTDERYSLLYNPSDSWANNEIVTITVTGTDKVPDVDGNPFSCYAGNPNIFGVVWDYKIEDHNDLFTTITAIADPYAPYLNNACPSMWSGDANAMDAITFDILDDHAGVDLSSIFVYVNNVLLIKNGVPTGFLVSLTSIAGGYSFAYNHSGFSYGSKVEIRVVADDLYVTAPNTFDYTYYYYVVGSGTLRIESFYPEVGITWDPDLVDIRVDVIDEVYDVDGSDLYLSINGTTCGADVTDIYGLRYLTTTVSGLTAVSGTTLAGVDVDGLSLYGTSVSGTTISGGILTDGYGYGGVMNVFPDPFSLTTSGDLFSAYIEEGYFGYATLDTVLVSGVNWDGKYVNSTITNVDVYDFYATLTTTTGTIISGTVGKHLEYHPPNDFDYQGAVNVLIHGTNLNSLAPVTVEQVYQLFHGYNVKVFDRGFNHGSRVNVYLGVDNTEGFVNRLDCGYYFTTIDQSFEGLTATIVGVAPWEDLRADITPQAPVHRYGETVQVEVYVEDIEGNSLGPYTFSYTIEEALR